MTIRPGNIRALREAVPLSQRQAANAAGFDQRYWSDLERGLRPAQPDHLTKVAVVLGVPERALTDAIAIEAGSGRVIFLVDIR